MNLFSSKFSQGLFWDIATKTLKPKKHSVFIIKRVMQFGDIEDWKVIRKIYSPGLLHSVVVKTRELDAKSKALWKVIIKK